MLSLKRIVAGVIAVVVVLLGIASPAVAGDCVGHYEGPIWVGCVVVTDPGTPSTLIMVSIKACAPGINEIKLCSSVKPIPTTPPNPTANAWRR